MFEQPKDNADDNITEDRRITGPPKVGKRVAGASLAELDRGAKIELPRRRRWVRRVVFYGVSVVIVVAILSLFPGRIVPTQVVDWFDPPRPEVVHWRTAEQLNTLAGPRQFPADENKTFVIVEFRLPARCFMTQSWGADWQATINVKDVSLSGPDGLSLAPWFQQHFAATPARAGFPAFPEWFPPGDSKTSGSGSTPTTFSFTLAFGVSKDTVAKGGLAVTYKAYSTPLVK